jgi:LemA protein
MRITIVTRNERGSEMPLSVWIAVSIVAAAGLIVSLLAARIYNRLVVLGTQCENGFSQIEVQLKRRYDLIPNLVKCVRSYLTHERETLEAVVAARNQALAGLTQATCRPDDIAALEKWIGAEDALTSALGRLSLVIETYPELKGDKAVADLTEELTSTENRIAFARQAYNDWVTQFNAHRQTFPTCAFAPTLGFAQNRRLLQFADGELLTTAPRIDLDVTSKRQPTLVEERIAAV